MKRTVQTEIISTLLILIGIACVVLRVICIWHLGVFADEFGRFSWSAFYGGGLWYTADMACLVFLVLLTVGGALLPRMRALKPVLFLFSLLVLALTVKLRYSNSLYAAQIDTPLWEVFGGPGLFSLVVIELVLLLSFCVLTAAGWLAGGEAAGAPSLS